MRCDLCGAQAPVVEVELNHNVGMLVMRQTYKTQGKLCRSCLNRAMFTHTWKNLLFGWWGTISFVLTWVYLFRNGFVFASAHSALSKIGKQLPSRSASGGLDSISVFIPSKGQAATQRLAPFENNVRLELRGGALPYDVAEGLVKAHGVDFDSAYEFVKQVKKQLDAPESAAPPSNPDFK